MLSIEYSDYPMGNHAMRFPDQRLTLKSNRMFALGFGCGTTAATMIPIINFFAMPVAVAGATAMCKAITALKGDEPEIGRIATSVRAIVVIAIVERTRPFAQQGMPPRRRKGSL